MPTSSSGGQSLRYRGMTFGQLVIDEALPSGAALPGGWSTHLEVPLRVRESADLDLFEGGVLAERSRYEISLEVSGAADVRSVSFCINDHQDLETHPVPRGRSRVFRLASDHDDVDAYRFPFMLTTGFSRVDVVVELADGEEVELHSQDVVTLSGKRGENEEDGRILDQLLHSTGNQAAEWMFSQPGDTAPGGRELSADDSTDWADDAVDSCAQVIDASMALVRAGIRDTEDGFPTKLGDSFDTPENRTARAFIVSMAVRAGALRDELAAERLRTEDLLGRIDRLVEQGSSRYPSGAQLPAREVFAARVGHIGARQQAFDELTSGCQELLRAFDACAPRVREVAYRAPKGRGPFASDPTYRQLREAMRSWREFSDYRYVRESRALHVMKPDRLYEYYCLFRLLGWLHRAGFAERVDVDGPAIDHFAYDIERFSDNYDNEERCANTYRLERWTDGGVLDEVDLYYVPVVYGGLDAENGIALHKLRADGSTYGRTTAHEAVWTPDYLLVVRRDGQPARTFVLDAKHMDLDFARCGETYAGRGLYARLCERYLDRMGGGSDVMPQPEEVWLLCAYGARRSWSDDRGGLFLLDSHTTDDELGELLGHFGLR